MDRAEPWSPWLQDSRELQVKFYKRMMLSETQAPPTTACGIQTMRDQAGPRMSMAQCNCQGVRRVNLGFLSQFEQMHDHHHDLVLIRTARASHRLFDLGGSVFGDLQALFGTGYDRSPPAPARA